MTRSNRQNVQAVWSIRTVADQESRYRTRGALTLVARSASPCEKMDHETNDFAARPQMSDKSFSAGTGLDLNQHFGTKLAVGPKGLEFQSS